MAKRNSQMTWDEHTIKAELHRHRMTIEQLARQKEVHRNTLSRALKTGTGIGASVISKFLGIPVDELWPHRKASSPHVIYDSELHGPSASQKKQLHADTPLSEAEVAA
ncbi:helix-turn-helix domain-containing protein [Pseudovibrio sp. Tun.PSC04-5.I4]|uniref:helix-turn-helix domain-containing protein n=1 Tax=Pseudovibrio sp. Tun.PSC04-5.I4 TaxID=1798213 RepID=UPI0008817493|nr:helix-turn-helix domain-containing protein [Pseudovibrio sp. Tun.PSC04-5.I4]SDR16038.1 Predicted transcriptional regulator, lambda repressor-like DNA-binding domain [Pseudovibrio sp. Tun.PSC04-5.I4]